MPELNSELETEQLQEANYDLLNAVVFAVDGEKIGKVITVFLDNETAKPNFLTVGTGPFGRHQVLMPTWDSRIEGEEIHSPFEVKFVHDAPKAKGFTYLSPEKEAEVLEYYGLTEAIQKHRDQEALAASLDFADSGESTGEKQSDTAEFVARLVGGFDEDK